MSIERVKQALHEAVVASKAVVESSQVDVLSDAETLHVLIPEKEWKALMSAIRELPDE